jgi:Dolichyl-phosphate-mannose-protein mannosyltransferase
VHALVTNHSLWLDESSLALNILSRNFFELTEPLSGSQAAPILFLWLMKATTLIADTSSELSLRLVPFLSGVAALIGFYFCCEKILSRQGALIAVALFAFSPGLITFSAEAKQYSTDVFVSVVVTYLGFRLISGPSLNMVLASIFIPAVLIWLSYPIVLIPIIITVAASATKIYPFADRLILFLVPQVILLVAISAEGLLTIKWRYVAFTTSALAVSALLMHPIRWSAALILRPANFEKENFRDVFASVLGSAECKAKIFVYETARNHYSYYHLYRGFDREGRAKVVSELEIRDIVTERPPCFWILYCHMPKIKDDSVTEVLSNGRYRPLHHISKIGADATLYVTDTGSEN